MKKIVAVLVILSSISFINKEELIQENFYTITSKIDAALAKDESYLTQKEQKEYFRFKWFWKNRVDENGTFTNYVNSYVESKKFLNEIPQGTNTNQWKLVGPQIFPENKFNLRDRDRLLGIGHLKSVYVFPEDKNHILVGAQAGGLWETKNGGKNWSCLTNDIPAMTVRKIEIVNGVIYAATGYHHQGKRFSNNINQHNYGLGLIKSYDGGKTWKWSKNTPFNCIGFSIHKSDPNIIFAVSTASVYKSTDAGETWKKKADLTKAIAKHSILEGVEVHPENPNIAFVYAYSSYRWAKSVEYTLLHRTTNGGETWEKENFKLKEALKGRKLIFGEKNKNSGVKLFYSEKEKALYASLLTSGLENKSNRLLILKSTNWKDWTLLNQKSSYGGHMLSNSLLEKDNDVYFGGVYLYHASKDNYRFKNISRKIHVDIRDLKWHSGTLYVATDGGLFSTKNNGETWSNLNGNLNVTQAYSMSYTNSFGKRAITIGTQDAGYYRYNFDKKPWYTIEPWGEGTNFLHPKLNSVIFTKNNNGYIMRSEDGGKTIEILRASKRTLKFLESETPILFHPEEENTIITELYRYGDKKVHGLFISKDLGNTWSLLRRNNNGERIVAIEQSFSNPEVIYMSTVTYSNSFPKTYQSRLYVTKDKGANFIEITGALQKAGENNRINDVLVHPTNPKKVWICFGNLNKGNKVFYSNNGGFSWENRSYDFPNFPVNRLAFDSEKCKLLIGTDIGVFVEENKRWKRFGVDLPNTLVTDLVIDKETQELFIGTYGRGVWSLSE